MATSTRVLRSDGFSQESKDLFARLGYIVIDLSRASEAYFIVHTLSDGEPVWEARGPKFTLYWLRAEVMRYVLWGPK